MARRAKATMVDEGPGIPDDVKALIASNPPVMVPTGQVLIDPNNANTHDRRSIDGIKGSIAKFGQVDPLLVRKATGVLIGGEGRLIAMQELGFEMVEVRFLDIDQTTATGLALALNRTQQLSRFDDAIVVAQLQALEADGFDVGSLGWNDAEMTALLTLETASVSEANGSDVAAVLNMDATASGKYELIVECRDEEHMMNLCETLKAQGIPCRVVSMP